MPVGPRISRSHPAAAGWRVGGVRGDRHVHQHGIRRSSPRLAGQGLPAAIRLIVLLATIGVGAVAVMVGLPDLAGLRD